jgi:hypothetical protein
MGTNYYVAKNKCDCCNRYDKEYHIGKSSSGWAFTFQGYKYDNLTSWKLWKEYLWQAIYTEGHRIVNEYGEFVDYDDFVKMIETVKSPNYVHEDGHKNSIHNEEGKKDKVPWFNPEYDWNDDDGYSFTSREFS